jgi:hypothetical protein
MNEVLECSIGDGEAVEGRGTTSEFIEEDL